MAKRQPSRRKRATKGSSQSRAKKDAKSLARSIGGFIPGLGTLLGIESVYRDGKRLMDSGPKALKSIGKRRTKRIGKSIVKRFKLW
jgi:hypothetical protein